MSSDRDKFDGALGLLVTVAYLAVQLFIMGAIIALALGFFRWVMRLF